MPFRVCASGARSRSVAPLSVRAVRAGEPEAEPAIAHHVYRSPFCVTTAQWDEPQRIMAAFSFEGSRASVGALELS